MSGAMDLGRTLRRDALLDRLSATRAEIVALIAPAGFGKSTLARQFLEERDAFAICDCAGLVDDLDLARRIVCALADESPERGATLSQRELMMGDGAMSPPEGVALALSAWRKRPARPSTFVFENAETVAGSPSGRELFTRLLAEKPPERTLLLCSRENLRVHLSRFAPPHRIVTLRAEDLAFSRDELNAIFAPLELDARTLDRIFDISQGWPVPVLFLARLASEGRHEALLERLGDVAFEELYEYLADQVLAALAPSITAALFAAACIPGATREDIELATGDSTSGETLAAFQRTSPFLRTTSDGRYLVHPLMGAMLTDGAAERRERLLEETARAYDERGVHLRAAELHLARPHQDAAALSLERVPVGNDRAPSMRYSQMVSTLDRAVVRRYPTLWSCSALLQTFSADSALLLDEMGSLWATLPPETPLHKRYYLIATKTLLMTYLGMFAEAKALLDAVAPQSSIPDPPVTREHGYALYLRATVISRMGQLDEAEAALERAWPLIESMDAMASGALMLRASEIARIRGQRDVERDYLDRSLAYAKRSALSNFVAFRLAEVTFGAWFAGEDEEFSRRADELTEVVEHEGIRGFRYFVDCIAGHGDAQPLGVDLLRWVLCGHLIASCSATDLTDAQRHARAACEVAHRYPNPFLAALAAVALAELAPAERAQRYEEARVLAAASGSQPFARAVDAVADARDAGMLRAFVTRLRAGRSVVVPRIEVSLVHGTVSCSGRRVKLADREHELLFILARRRETVARETLFEALWPDRDEDAAANVLNVHLHRMRAHLGDEGAIVRTRDGLRLCEDARVDLWEIERAVARWRAREIENDAEADEVIAVYERLCGERPARMDRWESFEQTARTIRELRCEVAQRLARYALRCRDVDRAIAFARSMIDHDPCDEAAREIAIAAHLASGDRAAAIREYRQYRDVLIAELQCEPSASLAALLRAGAIA